MPETATGFRQLRRSQDLGWVRELAFFGRGVLFLGNRHQCPCCGWRLRAFKRRRGLISAETAGYCPRCNSKARHRRLWHYLQAARLVTGPQRVLEVAPWWSLSRAFRHVAGLDYTGLDLKPGHDGITVQGDVTDMPFPDESFDGVVCTHVLEHVGDDRKAMAELHRVLRPGGWVVVSVPLRPDRPTHEDPAVTEPEERLRLFGERGHVRAYGADFADRLRAAGFRVDCDRPDSVPQPERARLGLKLDEYLFHCRKNP